MKKSLVSFALAASLLVSAAVPAAFAATTPTDAVGVKEQSAIEELIALGIIKGYEDGTFQPAKNITRAELAKIVVTATGSEGAAALMQSVKPTFKDVKANAWYTGYINVAATKGYIQGYNGNFRPGDNIKFEEVTAILLRALGYQDSKLLGAWPYNVLVKAEDTGLFSNVEVLPGTLATRAIVAQISSNTLQQWTVKYNADGDISFTGDQLIEKLGTTETKILTSATLDGSGRVELGGSYLTNANFIVTGGKTLGQLLGREVTVLFDKNNRVLALTDAQPASDVITGTAPAASIAAGKIKIKVGSDTKEYTLAAGYASYKNGVSDASAIAEGAKVTAYLDNNAQVRAVVVEEYAVTGLFNSYVAKGASASARVVLDGSVGNAYVNVDDKTVVTINGEVKTLADLQKNDSLKIATTGASTPKYATQIVAERNVVTGKVTAVSTVNTKPAYTVNGVKYEDARSVFTPAVSLDGEYKFFLNGDGKIVKVEVVTPGAVDNNTAILLTFDNEAQVLNDRGIIVDRDVMVYYSIKEDKVVTVQIDDNIADDPATVGDESDNDSINYSGQVGFYGTLNFNSDAKVVGFTATNDLDPAVALAAVDTKSASTIKIGTNTYSYNANTVVLNATKVFDSSPKVTKSTLDAVVKGNQVVAITDAGGYYAQYLIVVTDATSAPDANLPTVAGKFVNAEKSVTSAGTVYTATISINGEEKPFVLDNETVYNNLLALNADAATNKVIALTDTGAASTKYDSFNVIFKSDVTLANNAITAVDAGFGTFTLGANFIATEKTQVYVVSATGELTLGGFADITNASLATAASYDAYVQAGATGLGNNTEALVVVIQYLP